jgi:hypothetical protein
MTVPRSWKRLGEGDVTLNWKCCKNENKRQIFAKCVLYVLDWFQDHSKATFQTEVHTAASDKLYRQRCTLQRVINCIVKGVHYSE